MSTTPQMNLILPVPTVEPGPDWAAELNTALTVVDDHDHTSGKGKKVPVSGIDVNQDFEINSNRLTEVKSVKFDNLGAVLSGATNAGSVHEVSGNLYYTNSGGIPVQITSGNNIVSNIVIPSSPLMPSGTVLDFAGSVAPVGFLLCDGSAVSRTTYNDLFAALGIVWGSGDGSTTFNLPNFNGRASIGSGSYTDTVSGTIIRTVAQSMGAAAHVLTESQMPSHTHTQTAHNHTVTQTYPMFTGPGGPIGNVIQPDFGSILTSPTLTSTSAAPLIQNTGGGLSHNNMQPSLVVLKMIKI
jgi:microcystin-dependent protein